MKHIWDMFGTGLGALETRMGRAWNTIFIGKVFVLRMLPRCEWRQCGDAPDSIRQYSAVKHRLPKCRSKEMGMEAILFFVIWLGGAILHTLFDLRIKPVLQAVREESDLH